MNQIKPPPNRVVPATPTRTKIPGCLLALLIFAGIMLVVLIGGGLTLYFAAGTIFKHGASFVIDEISESITQDSQLPPTEKDQIKRVLGDLSSKVKSGEVSFERMGEITKKLLEGPIYSVILAAGFEAHYLTNLNLSNDERAAAHNTLKRFASGLASGSIPQEEANQIFTAITKPDSAESSDESGDSSSTFELRLDLSPTEAKEVLAKMKASADRAQVPVAVEELNIGALLERTINEGLHSSNGN